VLQLADTTDSRDEIGFEVMVLDAPLEEASRLLAMTLAFEGPPQAAVDSYGVPARRRNLLDHNGAPGRRVI
jgi:hypothetical protein